MIHNWLWVDIETTGLNENDGEILEVAACVVDDGPAGTFEVVDSFETIVRPASMPGMHEVVAAMHLKNGLLHAITRGEGLPTAEADEMFAAFVAQYVPEGRSVELAGASVHFDLRWIKRHMPKFAARLSHRVFDTSTLKSAARVWGDVTIKNPIDGHRAMPDILGSIADAKAYRDLVVGSP